MRNTLIADLAAQLGKNKSYIRTILKKKGIVKPYIDRVKILKALADYGWPEAKTLLAQEGSNVASSLIATNNPFPGIDQVAFAKEGAQRICMDVRLNERLEVTAQEAIMLYIHAVYKERT